MLDDLDVLVMLPEQVAEQTRIIELQAAAFDLAQNTRDFFVFVFHSLSPMS
jgi:hypothetical protein